MAITLMNIDDYRIKRMRIEEYIIVIQGYDDDRLAAEHSKTNGDMQEACRKEIVKRRMALGKDCCIEWVDFFQQMDGCSLHVGEGEMSGSVYVTEKEITFSDGWYSYPVLTFKHCPFCGAKK